MRTTASRSARSSKRQSRSSGMRVQPCAGPEALDRDRVDLRVAAAEPAAERRAAWRRCRSRTPCRRGVRRGRARPARARSRARRSRPTARARRPPTRRAAAPPGRCRASTRDVRPAPGYAGAASRSRPGCGSTPYTRRGGRGEAAAGGSRSRSRGRARARPGPVGAERRACAGLEEAVAVDGAVLELVRRGVVPDVRARDRAPRRTRLRAGVRPGPARSGSGTARR